MVNEPAGGQEQVRAARTVSASWWEYEKAAKDYLLFGAVERAERLRLAKEGVEAAVRADAVRGLLDKDRRIEQLETALRVAFAGMAADYCDSCGSHWTDIQNGCRWHPVRAALAQEPPADEPKCLDCGLPYVGLGLDVVLPRAQWLAIHPDEHGILCANCIVRRAALLPGATVAHLVVEVAPPAVDDTPTTCKTCGGAVYQSDGFHSPHGWWWHNDGHKDHRAVAAGNDTSPAVAEEHKG